MSVSHSIMSPNTVSSPKFDQASGLRASMEGVPSSSRSVQVVAVSSGKGGVGKTNVVANLAVAAAQEGRKVVVLDADLALGNIDILLGLTPEYTIAEVLSGERTLEEVLIPGPKGIRVLPATSGMQEFTQLSHEQQLRLQSAFLQLTDPPDLLLVDCAAGVSANVLYFSVVSHETLVVISPDPSSLTDAYALVKILSTRYNLRSFRLLVNRAKSVEEGKEAFRKFSLVTDRFLNISLDYLGCIPMDDYVPMAVVQQRAVCEAYPRSPAGRSFISLAKTMNNWRLNLSRQGGFQLFGPTAFTTTGSTMEG